ncbi:hypothetical protein BC832DRAFT_563311 [Gaertneriomyces semiglobifer]|nr:hypothetical protein BC832DRAFT_563311 [Gaertneriomyces semiglobifer]
MPAITPAQLASLQSRPTKIRNICILAHVDHGKTTLSDSLLASNGIISAKLSGKVRYLDSREDEQQRGITMKSSGISLFFRLLKQLNEKEVETDEYLINLIDSPGHVDFSSEVSTASRLCDGGLVLVDAVEGVCTQTHTVLRQAWTEKVRPILVLNKIDRLITELKLTPSEAYVHMNKILEQVNAIMGTFYTEDLMEEDAARYEEYVKKQQERHAENGEEIDEAWELKHGEDEGLYFSPEEGNVVFASAIDGWAFRIEQFAQIYAQKLGIKESLLRKVLWGDYYLDTKTKRVVGHKAAQGRGLKPMFVQLVLQNIWALYDAVLEQTDRTKVEKIVSALNVKVLPRDMRSKDSRGLLQTITSQWLPLSKSILLAVIEKIPSPAEAQKTRLPDILYPRGQQDAAISEERQRLDQAIYDCDASDDAPVVLYVSKMFSVSADMLPSGKREQLTAEEMRERRKAALARREQQQQKQELSDGTPDKVPGHVSLNSALAEDGPAVLETTESAEQSDAEPVVGETLIGFARIYSGTIKIGQKVKVLGPKYNPQVPDKHVSEVTVSKLYLMMGRELQNLDAVPAGNVFGIGGLGEHILKTGTITTSAVCPSFGAVKQQAAPIVRVALEPAEPSQMNKLIEGLRQLNQADPCVEVYLQETGEHVIVCAGELHLERCLKDLRERFAGCEIHVSPPIVPFRETISDKPALVTAPTGVRIEVDEDVETSETLPLGTVLLTTPNKLCTLRVRAVALPQRLATFLEAQAKTMRGIVDTSSGSSEFLNRVKSVLEEAIAENEVKDPDYWRSLVDKIWAFGPKRIGPNLLVSTVEGYDRPAWGTDFGRRKRLDKEVDAVDEEEDDFIAEEATEGVAVKELSETLKGVSLSDEKPSEVMNDTESAVDHQPTIHHYSASLHAGFQMFTSTGPLCAEPVHGLCIVLEAFTLLPSSFAQRAALPGQIITTMNAACRKAFLSYSPRLMLATYSCDLQTPSEVLGKVYAVLARRRGRILSEEMKEGTPFFTVKSALPIIESFGFADELRKRTSGAAQPQLVFEGFEVLDEDPFWVPSTEEELEDLGEKADRENLAKKYLEGVRKRKGLFVEKKLVEHAEKQRTLKSK